MRHDNISDAIRQHWDRRANSFEDETGHGLILEDQRRAWLGLLSRLIGSAPRRVLDVGCGTGFLAFRFAELGHTVTGIDLAPQMIERARQTAEEANLQIEFFVGDAAALDIPDATYDVVGARHVIWNLPDPQRGLAEWLRVLRPGGQLALVEGKWAYNEALALAYARPASRCLALAMEAGTPLLSRIGGSYARRWLGGRRYRRIEAQLPFSGGPPAGELAAFLEANGVRDVVVRSLMDDALWGETPRFPRYLAAGTRSRSVF